MSRVLGLQEVGKSNIRATSENSDIDLVAAENRFNRIVIVKDETGSLGMFSQFL